MKELLEHPVYVRNVGNFSFKLYAKNKRKEHCFKNTFFPLKSQGKKKQKQKTKHRIRRKGKNTHKEPANGRRRRNEKQHGFQVCDTYTHRQVTLPAWNIRIFSDNLRHIRHIR